MGRTRHWVAAGTLGLALLGGETALAVDPVVEAVRATRASDAGTWRFEVTLRHPDTGWSHYADGWEILAPDGTRLGFRELAHPHVEEQPFTRSLGAVQVPAGLTHVQVRARCSRDGWAGAAVTVALPHAPL